MKYALALLFALTASVAVGQTTTLNQNTRWTGSQGYLRTGRTATYKYTMQAFDVDGATFKSFIEFTAANTPTVALSEPSGGTLTIDGANIGSTTPDFVAGYRNVTVSTATFAATAVQCANGLICNTGDADAQVITLPDAVAGMIVTVVLTAAQDVDINPQNADIITPVGTALSAGDAISSAATVGNSITLVAVDGTNWIAIASSGTWTDVN